MCHSDDDSERSDTADEEHEPVVFTGPHGRFSFQAAPYPDNTPPTSVVIAVETGGFKGATSFQMHPYWVRDFCAALLQASRQTGIEVNLGGPQYQDCHVRVSDTSRPEHVRIEGVIGCMSYKGDGRPYRLATRFGFWFERAQLQSVAAHSWVARYLELTDERPASGGDA